MDRFDRYALYLKAWGRGHTPGNAVGPASAAGSIGVHHHISQRPPLSLDDFDAMFVPLEQGADEVARLRGEVDALERRNLHLECEIGGELKQAKEALEHARRIADDLCAVERAVRVALDAEPSETTPAAARRVVANVSDVGPSERDKRELEDAQVRLRQLIAADGKTDTGGRWLYDAAADEIVRQRDENALIRRHRDAERERADWAMKARGGWEESHRYAARLDTIVTILGRTDSETAEDTARRVAAEIVRLSAEVVDNKVALAGAHAELTRLGSEAHMAHEALEQARAKVDELRAEVDDYAKRLCQEIRALPLDGAPAEQQRGVDAAGLEFVDERAERKAARVGEYSTMFMGGGMLPGRPRRSTPEPADELSPEDADALLASGTWRKSVCGVTWIGPAGGVVDPRTSFGLRGMREAAAELRAKKAPPADTLSAEDAATLRGAGWRKLDGGWLDPHDRIWRSNPTNAAGMRQIAAELRAAKAPPVAHMGPGKATGEESATGGSGSVAEEQGATQGTSPAHGQDVAPHGWDRGQALPKPGEVKIGQAWIAPSSDEVEVLSIENGCAVMASTGTSRRSYRWETSKMLASPDWAFVRMLREPQGLPKPARVEVGQRWSNDWRDLTGKVDEYAVEAATANTARLIGGGSGVRYQETSEMLSSLRWTFLGPAPQDPSPKRDGGPEENGSTDHAKHARDHMMACIKLSHSWPQPARDVADTSDPTAPETPSAKRTALPVDMAEPTARDAVAGMLLRCGLPNTAEEFSDGALTPEEAARRIEEESDPPSPEERACIAALEALARGEIRVGPGHVSWNSLRTAIRRALGAGESESTEQAGERVARERNEARAAADMHINTISGAIERLGAERHESLWHAADRVRRELDETNKTNAHLENERRRNIAAVEHLMRSGDEARVEAAALRDRVAELEALTDFNAPSTSDATELLRGGIPCSRCYPERDLAAEIMGSDGHPYCRAHRHLVAKDVIADIGGDARAAEMRPAEDIAREMVSVDMNTDTGAHFAVILGSDTGAAICLEDNATEAGATASADAAAAMLVRLIERSRAEGLRASGRQRVKAWLDNLPPEMAKVYEELKDADPKGRPRSVEAAQAEEPSGMRIEKRDDGEYLIDAPKLCDGCDEHMNPSDSDTHCCHHLDGEHLAVGHERRDGACPIIARWPIASAPARDESSRIVIHGADDLHMFSVDPASRVDLIVPKALDPHDVLRTVAELLGLPVPPEETQEQIEARAYNHGFREGERRAGNELEALRAKVNSLAVQLDDIGDVFGGEDGRNDPVRFACARMDELRDLRSKYAEWQRMFGVAEPEKVTGTYAAMQRARDEGVEEGERRARVKAAELISEWEGKRLATLALRRSAEPGTETWARRDSSALIRRSCSLDLSLMFGGELPHDGSGDDGAEEGERRSLQARLEAERVSMQAERDAALGVAEVWQRRAHLVTPRLFPVAPGPLAALAERIESVMVQAFAEPGDGERRGPAAARWVLRLVDEHLQSVAAT